MKNGKPLKEYLLLTTLKITQNNTNLQIPVITAYTIYSILQIPRQKNKIDFKLKDYKEII